jgi:hypothetical protein
MFKKEPDGHSAKSGFPNLSLLISRALRIPREIAALLVSIRRQSSQVSRNRMTHYVK